MCADWMSCFNSLGHKEWKEADDLLEREYPTKQIVWREEIVNKVRKHDLHFKTLLGKNHKWSG